MRVKHFSKERNLVLSQAGPKTVNRFLVQSDGSFSWDDHLMRFFKH